MAAGDIHWFSQAAIDLATKKHDLSADTIKVALITSTVVPSISTPDPRWGAAGGTNLSANEVTTGSTYSTGGVTLSGQSCTLVSGAAKFRGTMAEIAVDVNGFTNARWGIIYNATDTGRRALGFIDLGVDIGIRVSPLKIDFNGDTDDIFSLQVS